MFTEKHTNTCQGIFAFFTYGISFGGGQVQPSNLRASPRYQTIVDEIWGNWAIGHLVGFIDCALPFHFAMIYIESYTGAFKVAFPVL